MPAPQSPQNALPEHKDPALVAAMFDRVARHYDRTNTLLSLGLDKHWRAATRRALQLRPSETCLDLAAGTAVSTVELMRSGATVIGCDFSVGMLQRARELRGANLPLVVGDALNLPFRDKAFDAVTISFGLRNVANVDVALTELLRVTRPGGRLVVCEFSRPANPVLRKGHSLWLRHGLPILGRLASSDPSAYRYLADTIDQWPSPRQLAESIHHAGWQEVEWRSLTAGTVTLHRALRADLH